MILVIADSRIPRAFEYAAQWVQARYQDERAVMTVRSFTRSVWETDAVNVPEVVRTYGAGQIIVISSEHPNSWDRQVTSNMLEAYVPLHVLVGTEWFDIVGKPMSQMSISGDEWLSGILSEALTDYGLKHDDDGDGDDDDPDCGPMLPLAPHSPRVVRMNHRRQRQTHPTFPSLVRVR
jgi:hypothetical protein